MQLQDNFNDTKRNGIDTILAVVLSVGIAGGFSCTAWGLHVLSTYGLIPTSCTGVRGCLANDKDLYRRLTNSKPSRAEPLWLLHLLVAPSMRRIECALCCQQACVIASYAWMLARVATSAVRLLRLLVCMKLACTYAMHNIMVGIFMMR